MEYSKEKKKQPIYIENIVNETIGNISYDNNNENTYLQAITSKEENSNIVELLNYNISDEEVITKLAPEQANGENDYSKSSLQKILNNYYYNGLKYIGNSTYDFTSTGLKNDVTRNMIANIIYNLGGHDNTSVYPNQIYEYERETTVCSGNETTWTGKMAIPYQSDYGYAADFSKCSQTLWDYNNSACTSNNWMKTIIASNNGWLLTPCCDYPDFVWYVASSGSAGSDYLHSQVYSVNNEYGVTPVLYLNSELDIKAGTGSSSNPYQLSTYLQSSNLTIQKDTGVNSIYYKVNGSSTYSATTDSSITLKVISGSNYYYYGVPHYGYKMDSCTKDSPCSGIMGDSDVNKTLSTTKLPTYTVTIKKTLDGGTATTLKTVSVVSNGSYSATYTGGPYYTFESVSCTNGQTATIKDVYTSGTNVVNGNFNITNVTNNTVCTIYISS